MTRLTAYCREHAPSLANAVSTGTLCHLTYMTLLTLTYSRDDLKLFCLIVCTDLLLLLYGAPGRFVERRLTNLSLYLYLYQSETLRNTQEHHCSICWRLPGSFNTTLDEDDVLSSDRKYFCLGGWTSVIYWPVRKVVIER